MESHKVVIVRHRIIQFIANHSEVIYKQLFVVIFAQKCAYIALVGTLIMNP